MRLALTLDTEADDQWDHGAPLRSRNVEFWQPLHEICLRHGVRPTWLVTSEIAADPRAQERLGEWQRRGEAEVGAHLHPWTTPPFVDCPGLRHNDSDHAFPSQLPDDLLRAKISTLTGQIADAFGRAPTSFRAGRFGFDARCARILADYGYTVDSSVTPLVSPTAMAGMTGPGPDFRKHSTRPFRVSGSGEPGLIEIPVTVAITYGPLRRLPLLLDLYRWLPVRAVRKLLLRRWLRPQPMWLAPTPGGDPKDLLRVWHQAERDGRSVAVMMFHSSELMPGGSPFRRDDRSVRELLECLDGFFGCVRADGGGFATLTDAAEALRSSGVPLEVLPL